MAASTRIATRVQKPVQKRKAINNLVTTKMSSNISEDFTCPVCLGILIEPVTMPCSHGLCFRCFRDNVNQTSLRCPVCRSRISSWTRKATRQNSLINQQLWTLIQTMFPERVRRELKAINRQECAGSTLAETDDQSEATIAGNDDSQGTLALVQRPPMAMPGEIHKEYEELLTKAKQEEQTIREKEEKMSELLITELTNQETLEESQRRELLNKDYALAKHLSKVINQDVRTVSVAKPNLRSNKRRVVSSNDCLAAKPDRKPKPILERSQSCIDITLPEEDVDVEGPLSSGSFQEHFVSFTKVITKEAREITSAGPSDNSIGSLATPGTSSSCRVTIARSNSIESEDSITEELRHFRPIKVAPKTPPRLLADGSIEVEPQLIYATPRNLLPQLDIDQNVVNSDDGASLPKDVAAKENSTWLQKRLARIESDRLNKVTSKLSKSTETRKPIPCTASATRQQDNTFVAPSGSRVLRHDKSQTPNFKRKHKSTANDNQNDNGDSEPSSKRVLHCEIPTTDVEQTEQFGETKADFRLDSQQLDEPHFLETSCLENDRMLALQLHRAFQQELFKDRYVIDRRKGTPGEYNLRNKRSGISA